MRRLSSLRPSQMPMRLRLTLWYILSLGIILILFAAFLYFQVRRTLIAQVDSALQLAATQTLINLNEEEGRLTLQSVEHNSGPPRNLSDEFVIHLASSEGTTWETLGNVDEVPNFSAQSTGYDTLLASGEPWRVYSQEVNIGTTTGWLQVGQELEPVTETLLSLQAQLLLGLPLALLLAGLGGFFLASRALKPIDHITQTAQAISASDMDQRIHYEGPDDEVGRLAQILDNMLDRLQAAFERQRRFIGDAAHELRTPLTALKGRIGVTLNQPRQPAQYQETLEEMEQQVDRLIRLSNDLLFMARLDQGQLSGESSSPTLLYEKIALDEFMGAVLDQVRPLTEAKSITLVDSIPSGLILVGNVDLLIRLHLNLLDNAVKYTPAGGRITVEGERTATFINVSIGDTGPGIPAEHLPHLFERFYRVEDDRARMRAEDDQGGAGLGLAIANEIARFHGGKLLVKSRIGQGTTFIVQLPAENQSKPF